VLNSRLESEFPGYATLARPDALSIVEAQATLQENEALVLIVDSGGATDDVFVWVVTKTDARWMKSDLGLRELEGHISALRCGLDASLWDYRYSASVCASLVSSRPERDENNETRWETLPFDLIRAHAIYSALLQPFEDLTKGKQLLVVPSANLDRLPLHLLVTGLPADTDLSAPARKVGRLGAALIRGTTGGLDKSYARRPGVSVVRVEPGGPGELAGLRAGDELLSIEGQELYSQQQATAVIRAHEAGSEVSLKVLPQNHRDQPVTLTAKLGELVIQDRPERFLKVDKDRDIQWLARRQPITVIPSVFALKSLRRVSKPSAATKPLLAVGNPLLDGRPEEHSSAELAKSRQSCPELVNLRRIASSTRRLQVRAGDTDSSKIATLQQIRSQAPLPETVDELCAVASHLKSDPEDVLLGQMATETSIKRLNRQGRLSDYRVLHFATHGTLGGEIDGLGEAGLLLTPPETETGDDDGYLSASEVADLKLDADWVVLSACNTAGKARSYAQLPRAFFYAGARAVLASHWAVASEATVKLVTRTIKAASTMGRAEALRHGMLTLIDKGEPYETHPAYWGPFVVMGEGG
jgi:CHAT domain-containing protein